MANKTKQKTSLSQYLWILTLLALLVYLALKYRPGKAKTALTFAALDMVETSLLIVLVQL